MTISKTTAKIARQTTTTATLDRTGTLNGTTTEETVKLSGLGQKITVQSTGTLAGNIQLSLNGVDFGANIAFTANTLTTDTSHIFSHVKVTRTAGSGQLVIAAV